MTKPIILHPEASDEFLEAENYYFKIRAVLAEDFRVEITGMVEKVRKRPKSFARYLVGTRRSIARRFPYFVVFKEYRKEIVVVAVAHAKRKPGYWRERLD